MRGYSLGCCAPELQVEDDQNELHRNESGVEGDIVVCNKQPRRIQNLLAVPANSIPPRSQSRTLSTSWIANGYDLVVRSSSRTSFSSGIRPRALRTRSSPRIGEPTNLHDLNETPNRKRESFKPLELSICLPNNRLSPLPDFNTSDWDRKPAELEFPAQALIRPRNESVHPEHPSNIHVRRKPSETLEPLLTISEAAPPIPLKSPRRPVPDQAPLRPASLKRKDSKSSLNLPSRHSSRTPSPARPRANTEPTRSPQQRSSSRNSSRRNKSDIDEAIRELNTIVEERRLDAFRASQSTLGQSTPQSNHHHIPAIAPSLRMTVRSETLSDIGSAFSVPLASKPLPSVPVSPDLEETKRVSTPVVYPDPPYLEHNASETPLSATSTRRSRLTQWLRRSLPSSPVGPKSMTTTSFYQCTSSSAVRGSTSRLHHSASVSTLCTSSSIHTSPPPSLSERTNTMNTTTSSAPQEASTRPSLQKSRMTGLSMRRQRARGLSIASGASQMTAPPAYEEVDPHPNSPITPGRIGLAY